MGRLCLADFPVCRKQQQPWRGAEEKGNKSAASDASGNVCRHGWAPRRKAGEDRGEPASEYQIGPEGTGLVGSPRSLRSLESTALQQRGAAGKKHLRLGLF